MKFVVNKSHPELQPGQLWKHRAGMVYLAVNAGGGTITLVRADGFATYWSAEGFGEESPDNFQYIGDLTVEL